MGIASLIGIPVALGAIYWLFVVNGPTPVVKARKDSESELEKGPATSGNRFLDNLAEGVIKAILLYENAQRMWEKGDLGENVYRSA